MAHTSVDVRTKQLVRPLSVGNIPGPGLAISVHPHITVKSH